MLETLHATEITTIHKRLLILQIDDDVLHNSRKKSIKVGRSLKLAYFLDDRYLSSEDTKFVDLVTTDLEEFQVQSSEKVVLLFPPVNNYLRLLIHKTVEGFQELHSFSVGEDKQRQTVVCWTQSLIDRDEDTSIACDYPRPQGMRGRGRGRFKDRDSPSPSPGNRHGSGDEKDRWSHDMYTSESGTNRQTGTHDKTEAIRLGLPCQHNDLRSSQVSKEMKNAEARTTSLASGGLSTRTRKPERSKNRRPDAQVYVPRARRHQTETNETENQASPNRQDSTSSARQRQTVQNGTENYFPPDGQVETSRVDTVRQKKKEVERYIPRRRREHLSKNKETLQQVKDAPNAEPNISTGDIGTPANVNKKLRGADNFSDESMLTDRDSDSWSNTCNDKVANVDKESSNLNCPLEDNLKRPLNDVKDSQMSDNSKHVQQNTSKHKHPPKDTSKLKEHVASNAEAVSYDSKSEVNIIEEGKLNQNTGICQGNSTICKGGKFASSSATNIPSNSSATDVLPELNISNATGATNMPESQEAYAQTFDHGKELVEDVLKEISEDMAEVDSYSGRITLETTRNVSVNKGSIDTSKKSLVTMSNSQSNDPDLGEIVHSEISSKSYDAKVSANNRNEIGNSASDSDLVKFPNDLKELPKSLVECDDVTNARLSGVTSKSEAQLQSVLQEKIEGAEVDFKDNSAIKSNTECAFDGNSVQLCETEGKTEIVNENVLESYGNDTVKDTVKTDAGNIIITEDGSAVSSAGIGELDTHSAELMETTESCDDYKEIKSDENKGQKACEDSRSKTVPTICSQSEKVGGKTEQSKDTALCWEEDLTVKTEGHSDVTINSGQSNEVEEDEDSWDTMFDDDGECLDPTAMEELTKTVGKVKIQKSKKINYLEYQPKDKSNFDFSQYEHIIEIYNFPADFVTRDLIIAFQEFMSRGFDLKWVDDTHALGIFSSVIAARDAVKMVHPLLKVCPLAQASKQSQLKARKCSELLQPYKPRPETSAMAARRLVAGALGMATGVSKEKREKERQQLKEAKAKKRQERQNRENIWEYGRCAMDEET